jgi:hypothetical protein
MLSYPLGAKAVSIALDGVPQIDSLTINFSKPNERWYPRGRPYPVLSARYGSPFSKVPSVLDGWTVTVEAVARSVRHNVQGKLLAQALPEIKRWLIANHDATGRTGGSNLLFLFDELSDVLLREEHSTMDWTTRRAD